MRTIVIFSLGFVCGKCVDSLIYMTMYHEIMEDVMKTNYLQNHTLKIIKASILLLKISTTLSIKDGVVLKKKGCPTVTSPAYPSAHGLAGTVVCHTDEKSQPGSAVHRRRCLESLPPFMSSQDRPTEWQETNLTRS